MADMPPPETFQGIQTALLESNKLSELAAARIAVLEARLEEVRADRDYWRGEAEQWQEQAQWLALPWWERAAEFRLVSNCASGRKVPGNKMGRKLPVRGRAAWARE